LAFLAAFGLVAAFVAFLAGLLHATLSHLLFSISVITLIHHRHHKDTSYVYFLILSKFVNSILVLGGAKYPAWSPLAACNCEVGQNLQRIIGGSVKSAMPHHDSA